MGTVQSLMWDLAIWLCTVLYSFSISLLVFTFLVVLCEQPIAPIAYSQNVVILMNAERPRTLKLSAIYVLNYETNMKRLATQQVIKGQFNKPISGFQFWLQSKVELLKNIWVRNCRDVIYTFTYIRKRK